MKYLLPVPEPTTFAAAETEIPYGEGSVFTVVGITSAWIISFAVLEIALKRLAFVLLLIQVLNSVTNSVSV